MTDVMARFGRSGDEAVSTRGESTRFEVHADVMDGDRIIRKRAKAGNGSALRREASVLSQIGSPHVVSAVTFTDSDSTTELITVDAGSRTLADPSKISPMEIVRALRNCTTAVRDLHSIGWEHGSLRAEHVVVGARGRIRLCSLGSARKHSTSSEDCSETDDRPAFRRDVTDLIDLIEHVGSSPVTDRTWRERRQRTRSNRAISICGSRARDVLRATDSPVEVLRCLDEVLHEVIHTSGSTGTKRRSHESFTGRDDRPERIPDRNRHRRRIPRVVLVGAATMIGVLSLASATSASSDRESHRADSGSTTTSVDRTIVSAPDERSGDGSVDPPPPVQESPAKNSVNSKDTHTTAPDRPVDPDPVDTSRRPPNVIVDGGMTYTVGRDGDVAEVGEFNCDGVASVVMLRPSTGELFFFDDWAEPGAPTTGRAVGVHPGATALRPDVDHCGTVTVELADGDVVGVDITRRNRMTSTEGASDR